MSDRFPAGTFTPDPQRASIGTIIWSQSVTETILILRHGEQILLNIVIPLAVLIGVTLIPFSSEPEFTTRHDILSFTMPVILTLASMSSGFTGQAISTAFDRRYGGLKRSGASGVPSWGIVLGKICAVAMTATVQLIIMGSAALILGWRPDPLTCVSGVLVYYLAVGTFTSFGLLMGGTLSAEMVLALANLMWLVLGALVGWAVFTHGLDNPGLLIVIPSVTVATALHAAFSGIIPWLSLGIMFVWFSIACLAASRWFRFSE